VEWDDGGTLDDNLVVDAPAVSRSTGPSDVLEAWDLYLDMGVTYYFTLSGPSNEKAFLFSPSAVWVKRSDAVFQVSGGVSPVSYTPAEAGYFGLVAVNETGAAGTYSLRVGSTLVGAEDDRPPVSTALRAIAPNPARGKMQISFTLHEPASVSFQVVDVAGRLVSEVPTRDWSPGRWNVPWIARGQSGATLSAGIYFLRMSVAGRSVAIRKFALVE
jgi:hypothetical protein